MMGAVLQTVNWRMPPDQIVYTLNHAQAKIVMINADFIPLWQAAGSRVETVEKVE